jgi:hypothetical protein
VILSSIPRVNAFESNSALLAIRDSGIVINIPESLSINISGRYNSMSNNFSQPSMSSDKIMKIHNISNKIFRGNLC